MADKYVETIFELVMKRIQSDNAIIPSAFNLWFCNCKIVDIDSEAVHLSVENETKKKAILTHYKDILTEYFKKELGFSPEIEIEIDESFVPKKLEGEGVAGVIDFSKKLPEEFTDPAKRFRKNTDESENAESKEKTVPKERYTDSDLSGIEYTFKNFIDGPSNTFAYNAAKAVAENETSKEMNPLFIYGPSGIGKTHLIFAIKNRIEEIHGKSKKVIYVTGEEFSNALIDSIKEGKTHLFKEKYRTADVLLVDDIQFVIGKPSTQEEFFHTFNTLYENNKKIIMTSDKPPAKFESLPKRLISRFGNGVIADIAPPDFELRIAILRKKVENTGLTLSDEIIDFLAEKLHTNVREIEGIIKKLAALHFLSGISITMDVVKDCIKDFIREDDSDRSLVNAIITETSEKLDVPVKEILGRKRDKNIQLARNVSMYIIRKLTGLSLPEIGLIFERKHSTVKSNIDSLDKTLETDVFLEKNIEDIIKALRM